MDLQVKADISNLKKLIFLFLGSGNQKRNGRADENNEEGQSIARCLRIDVKFLWRWRPRAKEKQEKEKLEREITDLREYEII